MDDGQLHKRPATWGKSPARLMHDLGITDGAHRTYCHMHWRYGQNHNNHEGQRSMADMLGVSETTIGKRIRELEANDWVIVIEREFNVKTGKYQTPFYHVFERQRDARDFRRSYQAVSGESLRAKPFDARMRKSRKGIGGNPKLKNRLNLSSDGSRPNSSSAVRVNLSSANLDSSDPESLVIAGRERFPVYIPSELALKVDVLTFPAKTNALFYAYLDALEDSRVNRRPLGLLSALWPDSRDAAIGLAAARITPKQVQAFVLHKYTGPGQDFWVKQDTPMPLKTVAKEIGGWLKRPSASDPKPAQSKPLGGSSSAPAPLAPPKGVDLKSYEDELAALPVDEPLPEYLPGHPNRVELWRTIGRTGTAKARAKKSSEATK